MRRQSIAILSFLACSAPVSPQTIKAVSQPAPSAPAAALTPASAPVTPPDCPPAQTLHRANLNAWKQELEEVFALEEGAPRSASQTMKLKTLLQEMDLVLTDQHLTPQDAEECASPTLSSIAFTPIKLKDDGPLFQLVEVNLEACSDAILVNTGATLVQVLRPLKDGGFCRLGNELSYFSMGGASLDSPQFQSQENPLVITPIHLLSATHYDLQVVSETGEGSNIERMGLFQTALWRLREDHLERIFETTSFRTEYRSPIPPSEAYESFISLEGAYPKTIRLQEEVRCDPIGAGAERPADPEELPCKASKKTSLYRFNGEQYQTGAP